jgi:hypothetical protein
LLRLAGANYLLCIFSFGDLPAGGRCSRSISFRRKFFRNSKPEDTFDGAQTVPPRRD